MKGNCRKRDVGSKIAQSKKEFTVKRQLITSSKYWVVLLNDFKWGY